MPRQPTLRKKKVGTSVYWFTKAGGDTYFGNVETVSYREARKQFREHLGTLADDAADHKRRGMSAGELMDLFLEWVQQNRSTQTYATRKLYCSRFGAFRVGKNRLADLPAGKIKGSDLESWLSTLSGSDRTRLHAETSVRHCWNWATKHPSPVPHLPPTYRPFAGVERTHVPPKALNEGDLITQVEIDALFKAAAIDLDQFRRVGLGKADPGGVRSGGIYQSFVDLLRCYYHTGARTDELASCRAADVLRRTRQVVLGKHKRSRTQRTPTVRHITLNEEAFGIFERHVQQKGPDDYVFLNKDGRPWSVRSLAKRFERLREVAEKLKFGKVRKEISIYDFRHLWVSEALMAGNDVATVARMAGTSIAMIERVYGHFRNDHLQEAQRRLDQAREQRGQLRPAHETQPPATQEAKTPGRVEDEVV